MNFGWGRFNSEEFWMQVPTQQVCSHFRELLVNAGTGGVREEVFKKKEKSLRHWIKYIVKADNERKIKAIRNPKKNKNLNKKVNMFD